MTIKKRFFLGVVFSVATVALLVTLAYVRVLAPVSQMIVYVFSPITRPLYALSNTVSGLLLNQESKELLAQTQQCLEQSNALTVENAQLKQMVALMQSREEEVNFLKEKYYGRQYRVAQVVSRDAFLGSTIWIDQGLEDDVQIGYPVLASQGVIVGKVIEVNEHNAKVALLLDNQSSVAATLQNSFKTSGLIFGERGVSLRMEFVPKNVEVNKGEVVVTSGIENFIPSGLVIGSVYEIENIPDSLFKTLYIEPLTNYDQLQIVVVLMPSA